VHLNDESTITKLVNENIGLVLYSINKVFKYNNITSDSDEYEVAMYTLYKCACRYRSDLGKFSTYTVKSICRAMYCLRKNKYKTKSIQLQEDLASNQLTYHHVDNQRIDNIDHLEFLIKNTKLKPLHRQILRLRFVHGYTLVQIGGMINLSKERIRQILLYNRRKLKLAHKSVH
jgi:RNA polymerase sigma factor (sigma-70 family)